MLTCTCDLHRWTYAGDLHMSTGTYECRRGCHANDFYIWNYSIGRKVAPMASIESATLCRDRACRARGMQVKLRFWRFWRNRLWGHFALCHGELHFQFWFCLARVAVLLVRWDKACVISFLARGAIVLCKGAVVATFGLSHLLIICTRGTLAFCSLTFVHLSSTGLPSMLLSCASITSYTFTLVLEAHIWYLPTSDIFSHTFSHLHIISHPHIFAPQYIGRCHTSCTYHTTSHLDIFSQPHTFTSSDIWPIPYIFSHLLLIPQIFSHLRILSPGVRLAHLLTCFHASNS